MSVPGGCWHAMWPGERLPKGPAAACRARRRGWQEQARLAFGFGPRCTRQHTRRLPPFQKASRWESKPPGSEEPALRGPVSGRPLGSERAAGSRASVARIGGECRRGRWSFVTGRLPACPAPSSCPISWAGLTWRVGERADSMPVGAPQLRALAKTWDPPASQLTNQPNT